MEQLNKNNEKPKVKFVVSQPSKMTELDVETAEPKKSEKKKEQSKK